MDPTGPAVDSSSVGEPSRFRSEAELEAGLEALGPAPAERGRVVLVVRRHEGGRRELPARVRLTPEAGGAGGAPEGGGGRGAAGGGGARGEGGGGGPAP